MSRDVKPTVRHESPGSRLLHIVPLALAIALLWRPNAPIPLLDLRILPRAAWPFWTGAAVTLAGLLFSVAARACLGRNWSGTVTLKKDHELVTRGPYRWVRHPIYTGLLLGFLGSAIARGRWSGLLATALFFLSALRKYRLEERWMRERFGDDYDAYRSRVKAIVPYLF